jgi:3-phosphoshikimate 1-carboxyvinyltransferase
MATKVLEIQPVSGPVRGAIRPPGSKSITNRALILAALATGETTLTGVLESVDTRVMIDGLRRLGLSISGDPANGEVRIIGTGGTLPADEADLWCENSGTSIRFLTALCAASGRRCHGSVSRTEHQQEPHGSQSRGTRYRLDGNARMRERPIAPLIEALTQAGIHARCEFENGCPPVLIENGGLKGGTIPVRGDLSSQYLSGLLMVAPAASEAVTIEVIGELVSRPYVDMTLRMMADFGAEVSEPAPNRFTIQARPYRGREYEIEPDASAASYFFAMAAVTGGEVTVRGLHRDALQGDVRFVEALVEMGCRAEWTADAITLTGGELRGIDVDMNAISDTAQTLACVAPFAQGPTRIRNVAHMRLKETDRVTAVVNELRRVGLTVEEHEDGLTIHPGPLRPAVIETYDDHRMAMSFSLLGLRAAGIRIADPECTAKTYPNYFADLNALCRGETGSPVSRDA